MRFISFIAPVALLVYAHKILNTQLCFLRFFKVFLSTETCYDLYLHLDKTFEMSAHNIAGTLVMTF